MTPVCCGYRLAHVICPFVLKAARWRKCVKSLGLKYKAALSLAYGAGLRAAEVVSLKISDIDSKRMIIRVEQGKGRKDRCVMLSPHLLELLRAWWRAERPQGWLSPGRRSAVPSRRTPRADSAEAAGAFFC
jgi:integrase/recombinase XerD